MYAVRRWDEEVVKWLALLGVLAFVGMAMAPLAVGNVGLYLATQGNGVGAAGSALVGAGLIRVAPEIIEIGLISSTTGIGIMVFGVGLLL